jgi:hypothetical protein
MSYELRIHKLRVTSYESKISDKSNGHVTHLRVEPPVSTTNLGKDKGSGVQARTR